MLPSHASHREQRRSVRDNRLKALITRRTTSSRRYRHAYPYSVQSTADVSRLTISPPARDMLPIPLRPSSNATTLMLRTINQVDQCSCTSGERQMDQADLVTCRLAVCPPLFSHLQDTIFLTSSAVIRLLIEATGGLGVILENRYYGHSYPYPVATTDNMRFLTREQSTHSSPAAALLKSSTWRTC